MFLFICSMLLACDITPDASTPNNEYSLIGDEKVKTTVFADYKKISNIDPLGNAYLLVGDTIITYKTPKLNTLPSTKPDLSKLKNNEDPDLKDKPLRMVSIGGGLTAGVRDGGYFNEGIITNYANLVARQMQLEKFDQPLFSNSAYNGFGRKTLSTNNVTGGPAPKFNTVKNNSAVQSINQDGTLTMEGYNGNIDNFAVPFGNLNIVHPYDIVNPSTINTTVFKAIQSRTFSKSMTFVDNLFSRKFDFFTYEIGLDYLWKIATQGYTLGYITISPDAIFKPRRDLDLVDLSLDAPTRFIRVMKDNKFEKGCFLNVPDITKLPYFKIITSDMMNTLPNFIYAIGDGTFPITLARREVYLLPTDEVDSLLSDKVATNLKKGLSKSTPLKRASYVSKDWFDIRTTGYVQALNKEASNSAQYMNVPLVDINSLYTKILAGGYVTDDGVKVDASYPKGNFFSSDGIYPTAFGQAVIANEVIKTINNFYKTNIPLINTKEFLN
jgi:hypothetical protein